MRLWYAADLWQQNPCTQCPPSSLQRTTPLPPPARRGDPANLAFGGLYRMDIALYRRHDPAGFAAHLGARRRGPAAYGVRWGALSACACSRMHQVTPACAVCNPGCPGRAVPLPNACSGVCLC